MSKELDDLLAQVDSETFEESPDSVQGTQLSPLSTESTSVFDFGDTLMAVPRGIVGAGKSTYGLVDALAFDSLPDWDKNPLGESTSVVGGLVEGVSEFATGMFALGGVVGAAGKGIKGAGFLIDAASSAKAGKTVLSTAGRVLAGAATDFVAFDGDSGRLTDLVAKVPGLEQPVNEYLSFLLTEEDDGEILGRIKNTLEGAGVGAAVDGILKSLRFLREVKTNMALEKEADAALANAVPRSDEELMQAAVGKSKKTFEESINALRMSDDFVFAEKSPFKGPMVEEAVAKSSQGPVTILPDGTMAPLETSVDLTSKEFPGLLSKTEAANWINLHGSLLENIRTTIRLDKNTASIGLILGPGEMQNTQIQKILNSLKETPDATPGELGAAAKEIDKIASQVKEDLGGGPSKQSPSPEDPNLPKGQLEEPGPGVGGQQGAILKPSTKHAIYLGEAGFDTNQADDIGRLLGGEFVEGVAERGRILKVFNAGQPAEVLESGDVLSGPIKYTDAVNPRKLNSMQRLALGIRRNGINLARMKDIGLSSPMRVMSEMAEGLLVSENTALKGVTMVQFRAEVNAQLAQLSGQPAVDVQTYLLRQGKAATENINKASALGFAALEYSAGIVKSLKTDLEGLLKREASGQGVADWEWADVAESIGLARDAAAVNRTISNALARGLYMQRSSIIPDLAKRISSTQLRADPDAVKQILMGSGGVDAIKDMARKLAVVDADDIRGVTAILSMAEQSLGSKALRMSTEFYYAALLSSVKTSVTNLLGSTFGVAFLPLERAMSAQIGMHLARDPASVARFKGDYAAAVGTYSAMWAALPEALQAAKNALKSPDSVLDPRTSLFDTAGRASNPAITAANVGATGAAGDFVDALGKGVRFFSSTLKATDEGFKTLAYRGNARAILLQQGIEAGKSGSSLSQWVEDSMEKLIYKGQSLSVDQVRRRALDQVKAEGYSGVHAVEKANRVANEMMAQPWFKDLSPLSDFALSQAKEGTYSTDLRDKSFSKGLQQFVNRQPLMKFAVPFIRTPVNIALFAGQRLDIVSAGRWLMDTKILGRDGSAFAESRSRFLRDMASGNQTVAANAIGRLTTGVAFAVGVSTLASLQEDGTRILTGRGPSDPDVRRALSDSGWLPYAIKIGDTYVSYSRMDPVSTIMGTIADIVETTESAQDDLQLDLSEIGMGTLVALANNLTNKTYLQGISNAVELLSDPGRNLERNTRSLVAGFVPNVFRDVSNLKSDIVDGDETVKEIRSVLDAVMAKVPGLADNLEPRRNALGEPIKRITPLGQDTLGPLAALPIPFSSRNSNDVLLKEMAKLDYGFSSPSSKQHGYDMLDIKTEKGQSSYDRWLELSGSIQVGGRTLRESLETLIQSNSYQRLSDRSVSDQISPRADAVRTVVQRYRRAALRQALQEIPALRDAEQNYLVQRAANQAGIGL